MTSVIKSNIAQTKPEEETDNTDSSKYKHSEKILIFGGIDENFSVSNKIMQLEFFQNKIMTQMADKMKEMFSMKMKALNNK